MATIDRRSFLQHTAGAAAIIALSDEASASVERYVPRRETTFAVIGAGPQGRLITAELARFENVRIAAVCDLDKRRLRRGVRRTQGAKGYQDWKKMLAENPAIQCVAVATPTHLHREIATALLEAGKHVYCEAPMASSIEDLKAMARAASQAATVFQVGHHARANPVYKLARSFYRSGSIDTLVGMRAQWHRKTSWRTPTGDAKRDRTLNWRLFKDTSTGLMGEVGSHQIDTLEWFTKKLPTKVRGSGAIIAYDDGRETPDTVRCTFEYPGGIEMQYDATLANSYEATYEQLAGTMGTIKLARRFGWLFKEADAPVQGWEVYASREKFHDEQGITLIADATKLASQGKLKDGIGLPYDPLYYCLERFLQSVTEKKPVACTALDGLKAAVVGIKANEAVLAGAEVAIDPASYKLD